MTPAPRPPGTPAWNGATAIPGRPRVAYIVSRFPKATETFVLFEVLALQRLDVDVRLHPLLRERGPIVHPEAARLVETAAYGPLLSLAVIATNLRMLASRPRRYLGALGSVLRGTFGSWNFLLGGLGIFPRAVRMAEEMERAGVGHVHAHFANHPTTAAFVVHRLTDLPFSFTAHAFDIHVDRRMLREKVAEAAFVVPISEDNRRLILATTGGEHADRVEVIHCGVDTQVFAPSDQVSDRGSGDPGRAPARRSDLEVLAVGSLTPLKGHAVLIDACRVLRDRGLDVRVRIVGDGPLRDSLAGRVVANGLADRVTLLGALDRAAIARLHHEVDVLVAPSVPTPAGKREGIPVVLMEAMASGLPVVASRLSGIPELVEDGRTGALVPPGDVEALAIALARLAGEPELRSRWGRAGRARVIADFDLTANAALLADRFRRSIEAPDRRRGAVRSPAMIVPAMTEPTVVTKPTVAAARSGTGKRGTPDGP